MNKQENIQKLQQQQYDTAHYLIQNRQMLNANLMQENNRLFILLFCLLIGFVVAMANYYIILQKDYPPYYVTVNESNQYVAPTPLHLPMYFENTMKAKSLKATQSLISYDYFNFVQQINEKRPMFTDDGWTSYENALKSSQTIDMIKEYKMIVKFKPTKSPVILRQGIKDGVYSWEVEVMGEFQTQRQDPQSRLIESRNYRAKIIMIWERANLHKYQDGIAIKRFEMTYPK